MITCSVQTVAPRAGLGFPDLMTRVRNHAVLLDKSVFIRRMRKSQSKQTHCYF